MDPWSTIDDITPGNAALRRQVTLRYLADGVHIHTDELVIINGALEALNLYLQAVTRPGDTVLIESPTFYVCCVASARTSLTKGTSGPHPSARRHRPERIATGAGTTSAKSLLAADEFPESAWQSDVRREKRRWLNVWHRITFPCSKITCMANSTLAANDRFPLKQSTRKTLSCTVHRSQNALPLCNTSAGRYRGDFRGCDSAEADKHLIGISAGAGSAR
jgi:hypothetical protein